MSLTANRRHSPLGSSLRFAICVAAAFVVGCVGEPGIDTGSPGPDTGKPDTGKPDTGKPDTGKPDTGTASTGNAAKGKVVYETYCVACHGPEGQGGSGLADSFRVTPSPVDQSHAALAKIIREGVTGPNGQMPGWADVIDDQAASDTIAYLRLSFGSTSKTR